MLRSHFLAVLTLGALLAAGPAGALTFGFVSDSDFLANGQFTKDFGGNVRWGNGGPSGDWELAVVNASDVPIGAAVQVDWVTPATNLHSLTFDFDGTATAALAISAPAASATRTVTTGGAVNALVVRTRAAAPDVASLDDILVTFDVGGSVNLGDLLGDGDAEYIMLVDTRLAGGFTASSNAANIKDGSGSLPMYGFKVGHTLIPEPGTALLLGLGVAGLAGRRRV